MKKTLLFAGAVALDLLTLGTPALAAGTDITAAVVPNTIIAGGPGNPTCVMFQVYVPGTGVPGTVDPTVYGFSSRDPQSFVSFAAASGSQDAGFPMTFTIGNPGKTGTGYRVSPDPDAGFPLVWFPADCAAANSVTYSYRHKR